MPQVRLNKSKEHGQQRVLPQEDLHAFTRTAKFNTLGSKGVKRTWLIILEHSIPLTEQVSPQANTGLS
jgi:hypothetical protein